MPASVRGRRRRSAPGSDSSTSGGCEGHRLAVGCGSNARGLELDRELRRCPLLPRVGEPSRGRPELQLASVDARPLAESEEMDVVAVVADQENACDELLAVHAGVHTVPVSRCQEERAGARQRLAAAPVPLAAVYEDGVRTEREVVQEDAAGDPGCVDSSLDRVVVEGRERTEGIVAVEAHVAGEVIPGAERDADERRVELERDLCDGSQRAVAARNAEDRGA